ncbi:MAG: C4-dicarboxylate ABC transporter [Chloroflexi bacterium]|nr:C4-dicarboxylate ABC transporter [Chloroflexota bacterium]
MDIALISLIALVIAIVISGFSRLNVGILAISFAWIIGFYLAGMTLSQILGAFPLGLATILFGITFLFSQAHLNGTLDKAVKIGMRLTHGHRALVPLVFFVFALIFAAIGPGNIGAVALLAPLAMAAAGKMGISAFLMTVMVANGANAGAFSPFAPTGIIANGLVRQLGIEMNPWTQIFLPSLLAQSFVALVSYLIFGGLKLLREDHVPVQVEAIVGAHTPFNRHQLLTLASIAALIGGVIFFKFDPGYLAITLASLLSLLGAADQEAAIKAVPWNTIMMVCGVSVLISILQTTGGMDLFTALLASVASIGNVTAVLGFVTGVISAYSSSSGVVMPAFIPIVPSLIEKLGGGSPAALVSSINVGSHLVDVSPLSTLGALCIANAAPHENRDMLFRHLLFYGLSMAVIGALVCYVFFGLLLTA